MTEKSLSENIQDGIIYYLLTDLKFLSICKTKLDPTIFQSTLQQQICKIIFEFFDKHETIINGNADAIILQEFPLNVGKSWAFTFFGSKALLYGRNVLHLTLEMSRQQVKERYFMRFAGVSSKPMDEISIWSGNEKVKFKPEHLGNANKVKKAIKTMDSFGGKLYIVEYPDKTLTIPKMERLLNDMELEHGKYPDLILIDGLQGLRYNEGKRGDDWKALEELTHELRRIMMENSIAGVASTHSQRGAIGNKIIQSQDIRGSIDILNVADLGISINQTNEEQLLGQARLFIMRSRSSKKWAQIRIYQNYDMGHFCVYSELME